MIIMNKFKQISSNVLEYIIENETKIKPADSITDKIHKLLKKFDFYKDKKDLVKLDKTMEEVVQTLSQHPDNLKATENEINYFIRDPMLVDNMKENLIFLAAKENKVLAYDLITKYQPIVKQTTILKTIDNDNLTALEVLLSNPNTKYSKNREDVVDAKMIVAFACQQKKMDFLQFGSKMTDKDDMFYSDILRHAVKNDWCEGVTYITDNFKGKISIQDFEILAKESITMQNINMAHQLKSIAPEMNVVVPNNSLGQKIKDIRKTNTEQMKTKNDLTP